MSTQSGGLLSDPCDVFGGTGNPSAVDLFRYNSPGSLALNSSYIGLANAASGAYFSYDGGATNGANGFVYNVTANGNDYADFLASCPGGPLSIQDAQGCPGNEAGQTILNDGGAEVNILNAIGYNLISSTATPEPAAFRSPRREPPGPRLRTRPPPQQGLNLTSATTPHGSAASPLAGPFYCPLTSPGTPPWPASAARATLIYRAHHQMRATHLVQFPSLVLAQHPERSAMFLPGRFHFPGVHMIPNQRARRNPARFR